jgi:hypothetical protein
MATYKITSDRTDLGALGATIDGSVLDGLNVQALIDGGHITSNEIKTVKAETTKEMDK